MQARQLIDKNFHGLSSYALMTVIYSPTQTVNDPAFKSAIAKRRAHAARRQRGAQRRSRRPPGVSISRDGHTAIVQAGAAKSSNGMVKAADSLKGKLAALSADGVQVHLTGASGMWSDFNAANRTAMLKSEVISWPVTLGILLLAFGSLVAAGLPLMLTMIGLASRRRPALPRHAGDADLDLGDELRADVRARARASTTRCSSCTASAARSSATSSPRSTRPR